MNYLLIAWFCHGRAVLFGQVLTSALVQKVKQCKKIGTKKQLLIRQFASTILNKYKMIRFAITLGLLSYKEYRNAQQQVKCKKTLSTTTRMNVRLFLEEDDNTRMCPGKKDHKTINKQIIQKRVLILLNIFIWNLYKNQEIICRTLLFVG